MSVFFKGTTEEEEGRDNAEKSASEVIEQVNEILGYDVLETEMVQADRELHDRAVDRLSTAGDTVPAEEVLGDLDE